LTGTLHRTLAAALIAAVLVSTGCASLGGGAQPAPLLHLVFLTLKDPAAVDALQADCDELLVAIPSVLSYASGRPFDAGRDGVEDDYDLLLALRFADRQGYDDYLVHPRHVELVRRWKPALNPLRIHDAWAQAR